MNMDSVDSLGNKISTKGMSLAKCNTKEVIFFVVPKGVG